MAVDAGPGRELLQREEEEEASRRARESQRSPVAGPPPLPTEQEEPSGPLPSAGPDSMEPGYVKEPWQPDRSEMEPEYGNLLIEMLLLLNKPRKIITTTMLMTQIEQPTLAT